MTGIIKSEQKNTVLLCERYLVFHCELAVRVGTEILLVRQENK